MGAVPTAVKLSIREPGFALGQGERYMNLRSLGIRLKYLSFFKCKI